MKFRHDLTYVAAPDEVFAMLADPAFREKVCVAQQLVSFEVTLRPEGNGFHLVTTQVQNTAGLPAIAKRIVGDTTDVVVTEDWTSSTSGTVEIASPGKPTSTVGTVRLEADGSGTVEVVELDVKVRVPLIGSKLEGLLADNITSALTVEETVGAAWLKGTR